MFSFFTVTADVAVSCALARLVFQLLFIVAILLRIHGVVYSILQQGKQFFRILRNVWNSLDVRRRPLLGLLLNALHLF